MVRWLLSLRKRRGRGASGSVVLAVKAAAKVATYYWERSADTGATWKPLPATMQAKTTVTKLVVGTTYSFTNKYRCAEYAA